MESFSFFGPRSRLLQAVRQRERGTITRNENEWVSGALREGHVGAVGGAGVVGAWADDFSVLALLDDVGAPAGGAGDDEERGEHRGRHPELVVGGGAEPIEVGKHFFLGPPDRLDAFGDGEEVGVGGRGAERARNVLDDGAARIAERVDGVTEADDDFLAGDAGTDGARTCRCL